MLNSQGTRELGGHNPKRWALWDGEAGKGAKVGWASEQSIGCLENVHCGEWGRRGGLLRPPASPRGRMEVAGVSLQ